VKPADTPDSVHRGCPRRDRHSSGPWVAHTARCYLPASSPRGTTRSEEVALLPWLAYLVLLRVEIARFTRCADRLSTLATPTRLCCSDPHLTVGSH